MRVKWTDKRTNESVLNDLSTSREMINLINKRRLSYMGHINRSKTTDLMSSALMGKVDEKSRREKKPRKAINITNVSGLIHRGRERDKWRNLVQSYGAPTVDPGEGDEGVSDIIDNHFNYFLSEYYIITLCCLRELR